MRKKMYKTYTVPSMILLLIGVLVVYDKVWTTSSATNSENTVWMQFEMEIVNYPA